MLACLADGIVRSMTNFWRSEGKGFGEGAGREARDASGELVAVGSCAFFSLFERAEAQNPSETLAMQTSEPATETTLHCALTRLRR